MFRSVLILWYPKKWKGQILAYENYSVIKRGISLTFLVQISTFQKSGIRLLFSSFCGSLSNDFSNLLQVYATNTKTKLVASLMSLMASLVTTSRMQQCFNVPIDSYHEFLLLLLLCSVGNKTYYYLLLLIPVLRYQPEAYALMYNTTPPLICSP